MTPKLTIGVDVSKSKLDYLVAKQDMDWATLRKQPVKQLINEVESIADFLSQYCPTETLFVFEPTGSYSDKLSSLLSEKGFEFAMMPSQKAHYFFRGLGIDVKTDQSATRMLTYMALRLELPRFSPPSVEMKQRRQLLGAICGLEKTQGQLSNRLHAIEQYYQPNQDIMSTYQELIQDIQTKIDALQAQLKALDDEAFEQAKELVMSIKGIGPVTAHWLLILTNSIKNFDSAKKLVKFC